MPPSVRALAVLLNRHHNVRLLLDPLACFRANVVIVYCAKNTRAQRTWLIYVASRRVDLSNCAI